MSGGRKLILTLFLQPFQGFGPLEKGFGKRGVGEMPPGKGV